MGETTLNDLRPDFDEQALVERAKEGDQQALAQLYERYLPRVYRYVAARLTAAEDAEDVTATVFLRMVDALSRYQWRGLPFGAWLFRIARNELASFHRRAQYRVADPLDEGLRDPAPGAPGNVEEAERLAAVREAISQLPPAQREVVELRFMAGLSIADTAKVLGKSETNVKVLQYKGVRRLQRLLAEWE